MVLDLGAMMNLSLVREITGGASDGRIHNQRPVDRQGHQGAEAAVRDRRVGPEAAAAIGSADRRVRDRVRGRCRDQVGHPPPGATGALDRKSTRLNSSHLGISYAV